MTLGLIADIGATNARFALADPDGVHSEKTLQCADYGTITAAARAYLEHTAPAETPRLASFAIAGPVTGDRFEMTNHGWSFSITETRTELGLECFHLMNDFKAVALAVPHIGPDHLHRIGGGDPLPKAPKGVIGPGTGLGVASLVHDGNGYIAVPGEGGHVTMAARTQREFDLFRTLRYKYRHVSAERVCSGKGLVNLYNAIRILDGREDLPERNPAQISAAAIEETCTACKEALDHMLAFLGTTAGNLALTLGAHGGIYIAGGIPAKLGAYFFDSAFYESFIRKGRFETYLQDIPVYMIDHPNIAFVGLHADLFREST